MKFLSIRLFIKIFVAAWLVISWSSADAAQRDTRTLVLDNGLQVLLMHDPDVLIMDEPTAGLDPNQIRDFRDHIRALGKSKTILISTHILQEVDAVADRVLFVHDGRLIFDGSPAELKEGGSLEKPFYEMTNYGRPLATPASPATDAAPPASVDDVNGSDEPADQNPGGNDAL